jgi:serine/threonine protein kinase
MARWRKLAGASAAALLLLSVVLLGMSVRARLYRAASQESEWQAAQLAQRARDEIGLKMKKTEAQVSAAVSLNPVRALVTHAVDRATLLDAFGTEEWWRAFREEFPVQLMAIPEAKTDLGREPAPDLEPLLAAARRKNPSSQLILADDKVYVAAAALIEAPDRLQRGASYLVLAKPFLAADLVAPPNFSGAVVLASDKIALLSSGAPEQLQYLQDILGADPSAAIVAPDASWAAAAVELAPKLFLWVRTDTSVRAEEVGRTARSILGPLYGLGLLLAASFLYLGFRRRRPRGESFRSSNEQEQSSKVIIAPDLEGEAFESPLAKGAAAGPTQPVVLNAVPTGTADPGQFGRYRLLHVLGEGAILRSDLGVLRGEGGFRRLFVIKRLRPEVARHPTAVAEFVERAQLGSGLVHSNIVPIYDFGRINEEYFIAQEHILGRDLHTLSLRLKKSEGRQLPPVLVFYIIQEILKALEYAHTHRGSPDQSAGVVHGSLSPAKVLISSSGEVKVLDFGMPHTRARTAAGRVERALFWSPEQARGEQIDARSDLFSVAMTMFWCLTGRILYAARTDEELFERVKNGPGAEERELISVLGGAATYVLQRALDPAPEKRFQTAEEFAHAIPPWEMSRSGERLHSLMRKLFDDDFQAEQASQADWQNGLEELSIIESPPEPTAEVRQIRHSR